MLNEIASKTVHKVEDHDCMGKESKLLKQGKPVRNINKNSYIYWIINMQNEVPSSHNL